MPLNSAMSEPELRAIARTVRVDILNAVARAKSSHVGSAFSCVDLLVVLYGAYLRCSPDRVRAADRDRFVMSKAHAGIALYATLARFGFFPTDWLETYYVDGGRLAGHSDAHGVPGIELSAGSLGHGLAVSVGMALRARRTGQEWRTVVLLGDGECDEGSVWEAALLGAHHRLANLIAIVDVNGQQGLGYTGDVVSIEDLGAKWRAFGWAVQEIDGHDVDEIRRALEDDAQSKPRVIVARTVKGKGVSFMEDALLWHYRTPAGDELARALEELSI